MLHLAGLIGRGEEGVISKSRLYSAAVRFVCVGDWRVWEREEEEWSSLGEDGNRESGSCC
jgi:hypothetical protein